MLGVLVEPSGVAVTRQSSRSSAVRPSKPPEGVKHQMKNFSTLTRREDGQTMAEYGVVLAVITLAVVVALAALSGAIGDALNAVAGVL
jgi:Flp pilus assembly pilin Flp